MTTVSGSAPSQLLQQTQVTLRRRKAWTWPQYLALLAVPFVIWEAWTIIAWLADGPSPIARARVGSANWYAAKAFEALVLAVSIPVIVYVVRGCRRAGKVLTFDVMFLLAGASLVWLDLVPNIFQPIFLNNSNFFHVNGMCGHMPFVVNPDCGRVADPMPLFGLIESIGILGVAIALGAAVRRVRSRWPEVSTAKQIFGLMVAGMIIDAAIEIPAVALGFWSYAAGPLSLELGEGRYYVIHEAFCGGCFFILPALVRIFKDDRGLTLVERGLEHLQPRSQRAISLLALYAFFQIVNWGPATVGLWLYGPFAGPPGHTPGYLLNDTCDIPGHHEGSRYGLCPGVPGYRMPGRHSLPGESP